MSTAHRRPVALITGASRGIGAACALALAAAGYDLALCARTLRDGDGRNDRLGGPLAGGLDTVCTRAESFGANAVAFKMDLLDRPEVLASTDAAVARFGRIDVLLNNGIYQGPGTMLELADLGDDELRRVFEGNVFAPIAIIKAVAPVMAAHGGGTILNMISATAFANPKGRIGDGGWGMAYAASKAAFSRVAPMLHVELGHAGIRAYSGDPGRVVTEAQRQSAASTGFDRHYVGGTAEQVAAAVRWLVTADPSQTDALRGKVVDLQRITHERRLEPLAQG